ncbi:hypothetical protein A2U01_0065404, partial [Trifolium medium]|nr:hypothetical protein [Trifolium medium]
MDLRIKKIGEGFGIFGSALLQNRKQEGSTDFMIFAEAHTLRRASVRLIIISAFVRQPQ